MNVKTDNFTMKKETTINHQKMPAWERGGEIPPRDPVVCHFADSVAVF